MKERLAEIERETGVRLDDSTRRSVHSLNDLAPDTVDSLRQLQRIDRELAVRHLVEAESHSWISSFLDAVDRGEEPQEWSTGGVLLPAPSFRELLETPVEDLVARIGLDDDPGRCVVVDREGWGRGSEFAGAPGRELSPRVDYRWQAPEGTIRMIAPHPALEPCGDPALAMRRWLAARIAYVGPRAPDALRDAALSDDARLAQRVLEKEADEFGEGVDVPGFAAPAGWYASS
jgi:hypothetical protein